VAPLSAIDDDCSLAYFATLVGAGAIHLIR
jgi:hypothetical protein